MNWQTVVWIHSLRTQIASGLNLGLSWLVPSILEHHVCQGGNVVEKASAVEQSEHRLRQCEEICLSQPGGNSATDFLLHTAAYLGCLMGS